MVVNLGVATDLDFVVRAIAVEVTVTAERSDAVFSSERSGAATAINREALATLPTIMGRLETSRGSRRRQAATCRSRGRTTA